MVVVARRRGVARTEPAWTRADVEELSAARDEPRWLLESRLAAWDIAAATPMPTLNDEEWRRTDIRGLRWGEAGRFPVSDAGLEAVPAVNLEPLVGAGEGGSLVFVDGRLQRSKFASSLAERGVLFQDLGSAAREHGGLLRQHLLTRVVRPGDGKFAALHAALWTHGVLLYVPRNVVAELPFHVVMYNTQPGVSLGHVLVVLEESAQATLQVEYASAETEEQAAWIGATELLLGANANLTCVSLQDWNRNTWEFSHQRARVGRDANLDWVLGVTGSHLTKAFLELDIDGQGANGRMSGFFFADGRQMLDLDTQQNHNAPLTRSDLLFKGAARDHARTLWQGMIKSLPGMQRIDGFQACRNMLLGDEARMDAIPGLEIEADDVKCSHAATFGTLEEEPIFYLMSRGISRPEAELMVIKGFFDELLERVPFERVRERLQARVESKIVGSNGLRG
ncbi:MAG: Fe-S cluster assembly protein SufD [Anaerolineaceae bacterium]|nr:Fe-S cluster assembly protein SufD [Anaerolineaceae bacterium]MDE0329534.1 Fe-S cluster assembly protein SufD [Anaerolineaceae bacterium]